MSTDTTYPIRLRDGFRGQIQHVIPRPILERVAGHPLLNSLVPTDIGWYPRAEYHFRERAEGVAEHILIFCVEGSGWYEVGGRRLFLNSGEALVLPAHTPHIYGASLTDPWSIHWVHFSGLEGDYFARLPPDDTHKLAVDPACATVLGQLFHESYEGFLGGFVLPRLIYCAKILHRLLAELFFNNAAFSPSTRTSHFHSMESSLAFLRHNLDRPVTLAEMARQAGLSESHFSRLFKEQTGHSPLDYFIYLKMQQACALLAVTDLAVKEVSQSVGYGDCYYFSRLFKKVVGVSPSAYRLMPQG